MTYIEGNLVKAIYFDEEFGTGLNQVVKETIVNLVIPTNYTVLDVWVFDKVIVTRLTNNTLAFYEKSLLSGKKVS